jgi:hypothetical protein
MMPENELVPDQQGGGSADLREVRTLPTNSAAEQVFRLAVTRMLHPACWSEIAGELGVDFQQTDSSANTIDTAVKSGDFIRIDLPGPGSKLGRGYDWAMVLATKDEYQGSPGQRYAALEVMASPRPGSQSDDAAHFFEKGASSSFELFWKGQTVEARYSGRNEIANNSTESVVDNVRNTVVASTARMGLSELQWKLLLAAFLKDN